MVLCKLESPALSHRRAGQSFLLNHRLQLWLSHALSALVPSPSLRNAGQKIALGTAAFAQCFWLGKSICTASACRVTQPSALETVPPRSCSPPQPPLQSLLIFPYASTSHLTAGFPVSSCLASPCTAQLQCRVKEEACELCVCPHQSGLGITHCFQAVFSMPLPPALEQVTPNLCKATTWGCSRAGARLSR